jgi:hypothetical protein
VELALNVKERAVTRMRLVKILLITIYSWSFFAHASPQEEVKQIQAKYLEQLSDKKFDAIRNRFPLESKEGATLPMLANLSKANPQEKRALEAYQAWGKAYVTELKIFFDKYQPQQSPNIDWRYQESINLIVNLYSGKINWAEFNKAWAAIGDEYKKRMLVTNSQIQQQQADIRNQQIQAQNQQVIMERNKKIQKCQALIQSMQVNCPKQVYGTGNPSLDLYNMSANSNIAGSFNCGWAQSEYNLNCQ